MVKYLIINNIDFLEVNIKESLTHMNWKSILKKKS